MNFFVGPDNVTKEIPELGDPTAFERWTIQAGRQLELQQEANKFWRENQQGFGKKPGQSSLGVAEARIPPKIWWALEKRYPDILQWPETKWQAFLDKHPEIDVRKEQALFI